jgi:hypothetical protein
MVYYSGGARILRDGGKHRDYLETGRDPMVKKFAAALAVGAIVAGGAALAPTAASAACWGWGCTYYSYGWAPGVTTATATYAQPVLVKKPVTTYVYAWSARPVQYSYYAPTYRPVVYAWRWGAPPVVAYGR